MNMQKKILTLLVLLITAATGAWALPAQNYLYFEVDGTSVTVKYGDKGSNPYYDTDGHGGYGWWVAGSPYDGKNELTTVTIDASCQNFTGTILQSLFDNWLGLTTINNLENLNTSEVTSMKCMFRGCSSLTSLDPSSLNTAKVTNMEQMFRGLSLETLDLSSFNTSNVTNMYAMFYDCKKLETIYVGDGWSTASVTDGDYMFDNCSSLPGYDSGKVTQEMAKLTTDGGYLQVKPAAGPEVTWDATTKQATFEMPAYDVELEVEYYPGMLTFAPNAIEGGTVEVVGLTDDALPAGFEKDAEGNIYVAEGTTFTVKATPEEGYHFVCWSDDETNTDPEREITMPADGSDLSLTATFAENEYDITFSEGTNPDPENPEWTATPNPAKTKQTVTVTYTGTKKVIGVKAEKKSSAPTLKDALADGATVVITYVWYDTNVTTFTYTNNGGNYTGNTTGYDAEYFANGMSMDGTTLKFTASNPDHSDANVSIEFDTDTNEYAVSKGSGFTSFTISVNGTDLTSQLTKVK